MQKYIKTFISDAEVSYKKLVKIIGSNVIMDEQLREYEKREIHLIIV